MCHESIQIENIHQNGGEIASFAVIHQSHFIAGRGSTQLLSHHDLIYLSGDVVANDFLDGEVPILHRTDVGIVRVRIEFGVGARVLGSAPV